VKTEYLERLKVIFKKFSLVEKIVFVVLSFSLVASFVSFIYFGIDSFRVDAPGRGGVIKEGIVGYPSFINPILSVVDSGKDLSSLLYSGLMRLDSDGNIVLDLAESYTVSEDGLIYTFKIRDKAVFHDMVPITADDIVFTVSKVKDPNMKSALASNWQGVEINKINEKTVEIRLRSPYTPFIENTTLGIIPKHIWQDADIEQFTFSTYNFEPVGSGPYKIHKIKRTATGVLEYYELRAFSKYAPGQKNISTIFIYFFKDTAEVIRALEKGTINSAVILSSEEAQKLETLGYRIEHIPLLRTFGVFFNQNQATIFTDKAIRTALNMSVDRDYIIDEVLKGYGLPETSPLPVSLVGNNMASSSPADIEGAKALLEKNEWKLNIDGIREKTTNNEKKILSFALSTSDNTELAKTAEILKSRWKEIGIDVSINIVPSSELTQKIIRPREYDALLFGEVAGRGYDIFPFWHSGERNDPGLNVAMYTNLRADRALESLRTTINTEEKIELAQKLVSVIQSDVPAVFLYSPELIYVLPKSLKDVKLPALEASSERWSIVLSSYLKAKRIWR